MSEMPLVAAPRFNFEPFRSRWPLALASSRRVVGSILRAIDTLQGNIASAMSEARERGYGERLRLVAAGASESELASADFTLHELLSEIDRAGAGKLVSLETDALASSCVLEVLLDTMQTIRACRAVAKSLPAALLVAYGHSACSAVVLTEHCRVAELLSIVPAEPTTFALSGPTTANRLGVLCAPRTLRAGDVCILSAPARARPSHSLHVQLGVSQACPMRCPEESFAALVWLGTRATASATLGGVVLPCPLAVHAEPGCIDIHVEVPACTLLSTLRIELFSAADSLLALQLPVIPGVLPPFVLHGVEPNDGASPVITLSGTMFLPVGGSETVLVFEADGTPMPGLQLDLLGMSSSVEAAAFVEQADGVLILADNDDVVAVDAVSHALIWKSPGVVNGCNGLAVLPSHGVLVASSLLTNAIHVFRLRDGAKISSLALMGPRFMASDPFSATVFVSTRAGVAVLVWDGAALSCTGVVPGTQHSSAVQPVAVMPPAAGRATSRLLVGKYGASGLRVFSLPLLRLVAEVEIPVVVVGPVRVLGIAADPRGAAIAVVTRDGRVLVQAWPLPGVPPSE